MLATQLCMVALGLWMVMEPSARTPATRYAAGLLMLICSLILVWRLHRAGTTHLTLRAIWKRTREEATDNAKLGMGPMELLSVFMGIVATNLP